MCILSCALLPKKGGGHTLEHTSPVIWRLLIMGNNKVLEVKDLVTTFRIDKKEYEVLRGVSFDLHEKHSF